MVADLQFHLILPAALIASASPGPATLAIAGTSMAAGRRAGLALAAGILTGSLAWSSAAALGLGAIMTANVWILEVVRYFGAGYLLFLAFRSARSALRPGAVEAVAVKGDATTLYLKGLALHLTNPKAILFFGSLYSLGVPADADWRTLGAVILAVGLQSVVVFFGYALMFSTPALARGYMRMRRGFEAAFALGFGAAGLKVLTARLQ
ncbi:MAG: LysE family translocator [Rhodoblastus sp.]|nr:MAG: LysE family translocator [Rhodoblastus sp.]